MVDLFGILGDNAKGLEGLAAVGTEAEASAGVFDGEAVDAGLGAAVVALMWYETPGGAAIRLLDGKTP